MPLDYSYLSSQEQIKLLKEEIKNIEHKIAISNLIYGELGEDTFEDLFRDNITILEDKIEAITFAIRNIEEKEKYVYTDVNSESSEN